MSWNFDISQAPRGEMVVFDSGRKDRFGEPILHERFQAAHVILATKCRKVLKSHWLPDEERWVMLAKGEEPVAWMAWPEHPQPEMDKTARLVDRFASLTTSPKDTPHSATVTP